MSILLRCDLCSEEVEDINPVMLELQHWLIIRDPKGLREEHFCRKCSPKQKAFMDEQREAVAKRQENE